eukprot:6481282-Amphidinium_carterae.1
MGEKKTWKRLSTCKGLIRQKPWTSSRRPWLDVSVSVKDEGAKGQGQRSTSQPPEDAKPKEGKGNGRSTPPIGKPDQ